MSTPVLEVRKVTMQFGGLKALAEFDLVLQPRELVGLIGPNGAGKTTAFNGITGVYPPTSGDVLLAGERVNGQRPYQICGKGIARTFQNIRLFKQLTALDNVKVACHHARAAGFTGAFLRTRHFIGDEARITKRAEEFLAVMGLSNRTEELAKNLPYGEQRRLEIARALASGPKLLCLDEPAAGMNASEKVALMELIRKIRDDFGLAILVIEHDMRLVMGVSERLVVLDHGVTIARGSPEQVRRDPKVIEAYLGESYLEEKHIRVPSATPRFSSPPAPAGGEGEGGVRGEHGRPMAPYCRPPIGTATKRLESPRRRRRRTISPSFILPMALATSSTFFTGWRFTSAMTSP